MDQNMPTLTPPKEPRMINADKLAKRIAGHSNYHGDSILAAIYCAAEGKENDAPIRSIETPPNEPLTLDSRLTSKMVTCPKGWQGVRNTRFYCPGCKKAVKKGEAYCHKCGQALIFPVQRYDKENNRIWFDFSDRRPPEGEANGK